MEKILKYSLILVSLIISIGGLIYKLYALNNLGIFLTLFVSFSIFIIIVILNKKVNFEKNKTLSIQMKDWLFLFAYLAPISCLFAILIKNATSESIISPWTKIPVYFFGLYFISTIILLINIVQKNIFSTILLSIHYFLSFSIAAFIYKLGYGFDPYIHEAAINHIIKFGYIAPKTFYYSGYYSLIIILHKITFIPVFLINKFIVPFAASIFLPTSIITVFKKWLDDDVKIKILTLVLLFLPFNIFILSTPQNLAYLFLLLTVLYSLTCKSHFDLLLIYLLGFSAFIIQPIAGIPALVLVAYSTVYNFDNNKLKKYLYALLFLLSSLTLPVLFLILNKINLNLKNNIDLSFFKIIIPHKENIWLNAVYLINSNWQYIIILLILSGIFLAWKNRQNCQHFFVYFLMLSSSLISYFFIIFQPFDFLINYERSSYADRIIIVAVIFSIPFLSLSLYKITNNALAQNRQVKITMAISLSLLVLTNLYLSYPRLDNYFNSHGTSTSLNDIKAVQWINSDAKNDYIVLANQQVSAASLHEFEFKKYYSVNKEDVFYYPIPTGGILYQSYLQMINEKPSKENANKAMDIVGAKTLYFVLNKYWWAFPKLFEEAKNEANSFENINNDVYVFKYTR